MPLTGFKALSADIESKRVIKLHFDYEVSDADRQALADCINMQVRYERLRAAAQKVYDGLNVRLDRAAETGAPRPVFDGIADLHSALLD